MRENDKRQKAEIKRKKAEEKRAHRREKGNQVEAPSETNDDSPEVSE
jgi:hypothetical protein